MVVIFTARNGLSGAKGREAKRTRKTKRKYGGQYRDTAADSSNGQAAASAMMIVDHNDGKISISWCDTTNKQAVIRYQRNYLMLLQHDTIM